MFNPFFKNHGPFKISELISLINCKEKINIDKEITNINDLNSANNSEITFFHSKKYKYIARKTKASYCLTTELLKNELPKSCIAIIVDNVLVSASKITSLFYPQSINDDFDETVSNIENAKFKNKITFGKNVLIGENVLIGNNCKIGHNTIIEKNVIIGDNSSLGSNNIIRNTLIKK